MSFFLSDYFLACFRRRPPRSAPTAAVGPRAGGPGASPRREGVLGGEAAPPSPLCFFLATQSPPRSLWSSCFFFAAVSVLGVCGSYELGRWGWGRIFVVRGGDTVVPGRGGIHVGCVTTNEETRLAGGGQAGLCPGLRWL